MNEMTNTLNYYKEIEEYATRRGLNNVQLAQPFVRRCAYVQADPAVGSAYFAHALAVAWMLMDLKLPIEPAEEDVAMTAALCHILPELLPDVDWVGELESAGISPEVMEIVDLITRTSKIGTNDEEMTQFYDRIKTNRLAYMVRLVDRGNLMEQVYTTSSLETMAYLQETKQYFLPLCIWGKENFPELTAPISIMMEKMRTLLTVVEILYSKYEQEELSLQDEILMLTEDNSRLRLSLR